MLGGVSVPIVNDLRSPLLLFGPTAVGKTAILSALCHRAARPIEVISADSRQVYRGFDIGTAKPTASQRCRTPHHLVDCIEAHQRWGVHEANRLCEEIALRGNQAIVSGGTAFYLRGFLYGLPKTPQVGEELRREVAREIEQNGVEWAYELLEEIDPTRAHMIARQDRYRIARALEIYRATGEKPSVFAAPSEPLPEVTAVAVGLSRPRDELYQRIDARVRAMFEEGLVEEVASLVASGVDPASPGMNSIGYREFFEVGGAPPWDRATQARIEERIARNTRRYAKRQETFFRRLPGVTWVNADDIDEVCRVGLS